MVRALLYRHGRAWMGASDRGRPYGFRYRSEQRGFRPGVFDGRERDYRGEYFCHGWTDWDRGSGPGEFGPSRPDVFVLQIER
jgi:hypothetical protein